MEPGRRSTGFVVAEGDRLVDWGMIGGEEEKLRGRLEALLARYQVEEVVLGEVKERWGGRRRRRWKMAVRLAWERKLPLQVVSRAEIAERWGRTAHERALRVAKRYPELRPRMPRRREAWMAEDERVAITETVVTFSSRSEPGR